MKIILLSSLSLMLLGSTALAQLSRISVQGNHFVTAEGQTIVFHGLATSDPDKLDRNGQWKPDYFKAAKSWGANLIRFPVHPAAWRIHGKKDYLKLLDKGVAMAKEQSLYV